MILSIHQPSYFPWLGLLDKIAKSDVYMVMDEVQLSDSSFQNRNIFLSSDGKTKYLTIGFNRDGYMSRRFCDLEISQTDWQDRHMNTLKAYYGKHRFFSEVQAFIEPIFRNSYTFLVEPVVESMRISMQLLDLPTGMMSQHELAYDRTTKKNDLVLALVKSAGADVYLAGTGSKSYMQVDTFAEQGIQVEFNHFVHPEYPQRNMQKFEPGISCLDLLFNVGVERAREIFWQAVHNKAKHV